MPQIGDIRLNKNTNRCQIWNGSEYRALCSKENCRKYPKKSSLCFAHYTEQKQQREKNVTILNDGNEQCSTNIGNTTNGFFISAIDDNIVDLLNHSKNEPHEEKMSERRKLTRRIESSMLSTPKIGDIKITNDTNRRYRWTGTKWRDLCRRDNCNKRAKKASLCCAHYTEQRQAVAALIGKTNDINRSMVSPKIDLWESSFNIDNIEPKDTEEWITTFDNFKEEPESDERERKEEKITDSESFANSIKQEIQIITRNDNELRNNMFKRRQFMSDITINQESEQKRLKNAEEMQQQSLDEGLQHPDIARLDAQCPISTYNAESFTNSSRILHLNEHQNLMTMKRDHLIQQANKTRSIIASIQLDDRKYHQAHAQNDEWIEQYLEEYRLRKQQIDREHKLADNNFEQKRQTIVNDYENNIAPKVNYLSKKVDLYSYEIKQFQQCLEQLHEDVEELKKIS
ncbi:unnamed protein product [Didymodactylos carnosus]|uniref:Uncharacterized protein n=1 Tax=Didymodactylos carnosus TaxID=1234261 RepID=A0A814FG44_9BILA|nr:unnamed protein product [Didymodactylos carnosus]CAF0980879.1 unnamed protein product [Didymodactylos carnosus]CAF3615619.1 unnamed protein product [Didymodactylos carnosus]CAF3753457.1 unnamed protein product [Didymodactylos carnosus]